MIPIWRRRRHQSPVSTSLITKPKIRTRDNGRVTKTAFDWTAYGNRSESLRLLLKHKIHVDTTLCTKDGYKETIHWQVISALCSELVAKSKLSKVTSVNGIWRTIELPGDIDGSMARLLIDCAYGEPLRFEQVPSQQFYSICLKYNIEHAIDAYLDHARTLLCLHNCVDLLKLSLRHQNHKLRRAAYSMLRDNLKLVILVDLNFHQLDFDHLRQLLLDDLLNLEEDEEVAWLAIVCWLRPGCHPKPSELSNLYNRMVSDTLEISINTNVIENRDQGIAADRRAGEQHPRRVSLPRRAEEIGRPRSLVVSFCSPLVSNGILKEFENHRLQQQQSDERSVVIKGRKNSKPEEQVYELIRCLRFMRFRSPHAFDVISSHPIVRASEKLDFLVKNMRLRYKLHKKLQLDMIDRQLMADLMASIAVAGPIKLLTKLKNDDRLAKGESKSSILAKETVRKLYTLTHLDSIFKDQSQDVSKWRNGDFRSLEACAENSKQKIGKLSLDTLKQQIDLHTLARAHRPRVPKSVCLLMGGFYDGDVCKSIMSYDFICDRWFKLNIHLPEGRAFHATCSTQIPSGNHQVRAKSSQHYFVYIFGGTNGKQILDSAIRFCPASDIALEEEPGKQAASKKYKCHFRKLAPMNERRCHLSGVFHTVDRRIYALGGHNGTQRLKSGEWYDEQSNQWHRIADMTIARSDASACSHDNKIFIAGGQISDQFIQTSVEFYKSSDNSWTFAAPMIIPRMSFCLVSYKNHLLAVGGTNGLALGAADDVLQSVTRSVERYNPSLGLWTFCSVMRQKRCSFASMSISDRLIVVGGHNGRSRLRACESLRIGQLVSNTNANHTGPSSFAPGHNNGTQPRSAGTPFASNRDRLDERFPFSPRQQQPLFPLDQAESTLSLRSAMKWSPRAKLPESRSGFSLVVLNDFPLAKDTTYSGSLKKRALHRVDDSSQRTANKIWPTLIKQPGRWHRFKLIRRRKLKRHLKIALVLSIIVLLL